MVSIPGLTRSKGRVSHAGKSSTASSPRNVVRSLVSRSASAVMGTAARIGRRVPTLVSAASVTARAASGTARTAAERPST